MRPRGVGFVAALISGTHASLSHRNLSGLEHRHPCKAPRAPVRPSAKHTSSRPKTAPLALGRGAQ